MVFTNAGAHIVELAARGELNGETVGALVVVILTGQQQAIDAHTAALGDDLHSGVVHGIPQVTDALVGLTPAAHDVRQVLLRDAHVQGSHVDECAGAALVAQGQLCHLALLPECILWIALFDELNGHAEHLRGGGLIDFSVGAEHLQPPLLTGQPGDDTGLNGRKVSVNEDMPLRGHKGGADELAEGVRHGAIDQPEGIQLAVLHQLTGQRQRLCVGAGQVLDLHQAACPAPRPVRSIELEQPTDTAIRAHSGLNSVILFGAGLAQLLAYLKHPLDLGAVVLLAQQAGHGVLAEVRKLLSHGLLEPLRELCHAVGVVQLGDFHGLLGEVLAGHIAQIEGTAHQVHVHGHATGIDDEVRFPLLLHEVRHGESREPPLNLHLSHNILAAVFFEQLPLVGVVLGQVAGAASIGLCRGARDAEITDERLAGVELALVLSKPQGLASGIQACCVATIEAVEHGAAPLVRRQGAQKLGQAAPLKGGVVCVLDVLRGGDGLDQPRGEHLPPCQVNDLNRRTIHTVRKEQDFKVRAGDVLLRPGLSNRHA